MPNTTREDIEFGGTSTFSLDELRYATTRPYHASKLDRLVCLIGLGGCRERFTLGELVWSLVSASLISSGLTGCVLLAL